MFIRWLETTCGMKPLRQSFWLGPMLTAGCLFGGMDQSHCGLPCRSWERRFSCTTGLVSISIVKAIVYWVLTYIQNCAWTHFVRQMDLILLSLLFLYTVSLCGLHGLCNILENSFYISSRHIRHLCVWLLKPQVYLVQGLTTIEYV